MLDEKVSYLKCCYYIQRNINIIALIYNMLINIYDKSLRSETNKLNRLFSMKRITIKSNKFN